MRTLPLMKQGLIPVLSDRIASVARSGELLALLDKILDFFNAHKDKYKDKRGFIEDLLTKDPALGLQEIIDLDSDFTGLEDC